MGAGATCRIQACRWIVATPNPFEKYLPELGLASESDNEFSDSEYPIEEPTQLQQPEQPTAPSANPFDKYLPELGLAEPEPEPVPPPEEMGTIANLFAGLRERGAGLVGDVAGFAETTGGFLEEGMPLGGLVYDEQGLQYLSPTEWTQYNQQDGRSLLRDFQEDWKNTSYGFTSDAAQNWEMVKTNPNLIEKAKALGAFALETGVISLADMAGAVLTPAPYLAARSEEIAQERATQDGRPGQVTEQDLSVGFATAAIITAMERLGFESIASAFIKGGTLPQKVLKGVVGEGGTEFVQEQLEYGAETLGTKAQEPTLADYASASLERGLQGFVGGGPVGGVGAAVGAAIGPKEDPISKNVLPAEANKDAITTALNKRLLEMEQEGVVRDEREMLESEQQAQEMELARKIEEMDAQETPYKTAAHAEAKRQQIEKKYGETGLETVQDPEGNWILAHRGRASMYNVARERAERMGVGLRPAEEGQIEVTEGEEITATEPSPTTEGIEVGEEIIATEPSPTTEGIEVREEPIDLWQEPTRATIGVTEVTPEEVTATEPAPTTEGIEVTEVQPEEVGEAIPQIGVQEVAPEEAGIEVIEAPRKIYTRKPAARAEPEPEPTAAEEEVQPIMPSVTSGAIKKGRKPRKGVEKELAQVEAQLAEMPTNVDAMSEEAPAQTDRIHELQTQRRDLLDEQQYGVTAEEAAQARAELRQQLHDEQGKMAPRYATIKELSDLIKRPKLEMVSQGVYDRAVKAIAEAAEEGITPTVEFLQQKLGLSATSAKRQLDRYNREVMEGEPDTTPLVSPETPVEQTQEAPSAEEIRDMERGAFGTKKQMAEVREKYGIDNEEIFRRWEANRGITRDAAPVEHPKVPGRMDTDTLPDGSTYDLSKSAETQIATTVGTYDKVKARYFEDVDNGDILDYGAGKGLASQKYGFESLEPYPRGWTPSYQNTYRIKRQYDGIILNNILNVLPKHTRRAVMWDAAEKLRPGGQMYINVRSRGDVMKTTVIAKRFNDSEILTGRGTYQKGFQQQELINFIQDELGPDYAVESAEFGSVSVMVTKQGGATDVDALTAEAAKAEADKTIEGREAVDEEAQVAAFNFVDSNPAFTGLKLSHKPGDERYGETLAHYYGDLDRTEGADGDPLDVLLGKDFEIGKEYPAFIVNLIDPKTGDFEQHKVVSGVDDILEAEEVVEDMYPDQVDDISQITPEEFTRFAKSKRTKEPFDRDTFRGEMNQGKDLGKPTETDTVLDPTELGSTQADAIDYSPWLLADGSIVGTGGDHMAYAMERGMNADSGQDLRAISQMQLEGGGVRAAFFYDEPNNTNIAWLHLHDDQALTDAQIAAVEKYVQASKKAGRKGTILIGSTPSYEAGNPEINPVVKKSSIAALKRDWGARKAKYRADMAKFYATLSDKSARYSTAAIGRIKAQLRADPTKDDLITFLRKHGGINVNLAGDVRGRLGHLNSEYRLPGLPGIEQTDGSGLTLEQAAEIATEAEYIRPGREDNYDTDELIEALWIAESGGKVYSDQNTEWVAEGWAAEQERAEAEFEAQQAAEAEAWVEGIGDEPVIDTEMRQLMAMASLVDEQAAEEIASRAVDDAVVKQQLQELIDERKRKQAPEQAKGPEAEEGVPADGRVETEAAAAEGREPVRTGREEPAEKPDPGDYDSVDEYPWQDLAQAAGVEILEPPTPDIEGPRTFVIDVYSDLQRTKFSHRVYAANFFRYRDVETAFLSRMGPYRARLQDRNEWIEISKLSFENTDGHHALIDEIEGSQNKPYRKLDTIKRIEDKRGAERKQERQRREAGWLTPEQWGNTVGRYQDELMAEPNPADVHSFWGEEFKKGQTPRNYISHEEGRKKIASWKKHAKDVGKKNIGNSQRVILSLFDETGEWAQPWIDAGYDVRAIDLKRDDVDIMDIDYGWLLDMGFLEGPGIWGIMAACPCQKFTGTSARDRKPVELGGKPRPSKEGGTDYIGETHASVDLVNQTLSIIDFLKPRFWALENPVGRIKDITGVPAARLSFNPNNFGDPYTKKTQIYGNFNADLPTANVDPRKENGGEGSRTHSLGGKDELDGGLRSVTPEGFSYAFFMANNDFDNPVADEIVQKEFVRTIPDEVKAKDPNIERKVELVAKLALLDDTYPTEADLADGTVADYHSGNYRLTETDSWPKWAKKLISDIEEAVQDDWRIDDGNVATVRELNELDAELRTLLGVPQKAGVKYPQKEEIDAEPIDSLNELGETYANEDFSIIDPYMMEAAVDAVNIAIENLAARGYTFTDVHDQPGMSLPTYLGGPREVIIDITSGAIPVAKALKAVQKGDKRTKPETALERLYNWKLALDKQTSQIVVSEKEFRNHVREEYPFLAKALDAKTDEDPGLAMRRQLPGYTEAQREVYESLGREDMAWAPAPEPQPWTEEEVAQLPPQGEPTTERGPEWAPVPERERPPEVDIDGVLEASTRGPETAKPLSDVALTAEDGDRRVTHNAKWWKDAIDQRLKNLNKIRGCA